MSSNSKKLEQNNNKKQMHDSPQLLPGRGKPLVPEDDREEAGLSLGESIKDRIHQITTGMNDHEPTTAPGDIASLEKSARKKEKEKGDYTRVTTLSYDEVDPS